MTFGRNPNHSEHGVLKFAAPFWGKPRWAALFVAIGRQIQEVEDALCAVIDSRALDNATGAQLALLGKLVGQADPGLGEAVFKNLIRVRIRINRSEGGRDDLIEVLQLLGIPLAQRTITDSPPAKLLVKFTGVLPLPIVLLTQLMNDTVAGGVGVVVLYEPGASALDGFAYTNASLSGGVNDVFSNNTIAGAGSWSGVFQV